MRKLLILTACASASIMLAGCNSAPKEEAPAEPAATETAAPETAAPEAMAPTEATPAPADAAAAPAEEATDGSDDTETGGGGIKPVNSGN